MNIILQITSTWEGLQQHESFKKYFFNTSWLFLEKGLRLTVGFFLGLLVARYLGPQKFGQLSYVQSFVAIFASIATLGIDEIVVRELVKNENKNDVLLGTAVALKAFGSALLFVVIGIMIRFTSNDEFTNTLIFLLAAMSIFEIFSVAKLYFQAKVLAKYSILANIISLSVYSITQVILILLKADILAFVMTFILQSSTFTLGCLYFYHKQNKSIRNWVFNFDLAKKLLKDSWPLIFTGLVIMICMRIDQIMIKEILGISSVGNYTAATMLSEAWYFIPMVLCSSLFPAIINAKARSETLYFQRLEKLYFLLFWLALLIITPITLFSNSIIDLFFGEKFSQSAGVLAIHIWTVFFVSLGVAKGRFMVAENIQWLSAVYSSIGAIFNILLNYFLIPWLGIKGAAIASLTTQILTSAALPIFHCKDRKSVIIFFSSFRKIDLFKEIFSIRFLKGSPTV